jgi:hypothetical protein
MITKHKCDKVKDVPWQDRIKECCEKDDPENPSGCDCCYDSWTEELKEVKTKFSEADEEAKLVTLELTFITERRDKLKIWYDELTRVNDLSQKICDQIEVFLSQIDKIFINTEYAIKAIQVLYCMIRDFYMQVDLIRQKYDQIFSCIRCLKDPILVPGQGIMKCLEDYGKKLDALIATRDELLKMIMAAIYTAYRINKNLGKDYGLYMEISEWQTTFNCEEGCGEGESRPGYTAQTSEIRQESYGEENENKEKNCKLRPRFNFPVCNDRYYKKIGRDYEQDKKEASDLAKKLIDLNKKKESLLACKQSLDTAITEVSANAKC